MNINIKLFIFNSNLASRLKIKLMLKICVLIIINICVFIIINRTKPWSFCIYTIFIIVKKK